MTRHNFTQPFSSFYGNLARFGKVVSYQKLQFAEKLTETQDF